MGEGEDAADEAESVNGESKEIASNMEERIDAAKEFAVDCKSQSQLLRARRTFAIYIPQSKC